MPIFIYTAKNQQGESRIGNMEAGDQHELATKLRKQGLILISANPIGSKEKENITFGLGKLIRKFGKISLVEKMTFTRHLSVMIRAGLPINESLKALSEQSKNPKFKKIISRIESNVRKGQPLSKSMAEYPKIFSELYVSMVEAGETGGNLETVLENLAEQIRKDHELISRIKGAMVYPIVVIIALIGVGITMMVVVVPKLTEMFTELNMELPITTRIIIGLSNFIQNHLFYGTVILILLFLIIRLIVKNRIVKKGFHKIYLHLPVFGELIKKINSARFSRTFSSLIDSGVDIVKALQIVSRTLENIHFREALENSSAQIRKGQDLSKTLAGHENIFPPMVVQMIQVGEKTGNLSKVLNTLADFYEEEIDRTTKNLSSIVEPIIMIIVGIAVGFFAIAMIQPMYSMMSGL